jgi:lysophospholipase L1-like esterase
MISKKALLFVFSSILACATFAQQPATQMDPSKIMSTTLGILQPTEKAPEALLVKPGEKVMFVGDSITAGGGYLRLAAYVLKTSYPELNLPQFINVGVSGQKAEGMEPRFESDLKKADKPALVFISVGINDVWHRAGQPHDPAVLATYKENVSKMVDKAQAAGAKVVLLAPTVIQEDTASEGNKRLPMYVDAMKSVAADKKCGFADLHSMFLQAIAKKPADLKLTSDGVHMGPYGDSIMAIGVLRAMGVPDAKMSSIDLTPILNIRLTMPIENVAKQLEVPISKLLSIKGAGFSL